MNNPDYKKIALKIGRLGFFTDIHNCGAPTESWPVNLYCEMKGLRFYVAYIKYSGGWEVDYTRDVNVAKRSDMHHITHLKNQTQTLKFIEALVNNQSVKVFHDGSVEVEV